MVESKRNPLIFRFLILVASTPESYETAENGDAPSDFDDDEDDDDDEEEDANEDDDVRTRIIRG